MKRFRKKQEIYVAQWTGDKSIVKDIKSVIKEYNEEMNEEYFKVVIDDDILCLSYGSYRDGGGVLSSFLQIGEYVVFDYNEDHPFFGIDEKYLKEIYVEL